MLHFVVSYGLLLLACGYAVLKGDWPERLTGSLMLLGVGATVVVYYVLKIAYTRLDIAILAIDLSFLIAMIWITMKADRFWTIPFTALHLLTMGGHLLKVAEADIQPLIYKILVAAPIYPMLLMLAWATGRASVRRAARPQKSFRGYFPSMASLMRRGFRDF